MYLLTEADDYIVDERGNALLLDTYETCAWPTLVEVKTELGIVGSDENTFLQRAINATVNSIEKYLGRKIPAEVDSEIFRITRCDRGVGYTSCVQLRRWPIIEVIACFDQVAEFDITYETDEHGRLCGNFNDGSLVQVDYHGGMCPIPDDIISVFYGIVSYRYARKDVTAATGIIKKESIPGVMAVEYFSGTEGSMSTGCGINPASYSYTLDAYRAYFV